MSEEQHHPHRRPPAARPRRDAPPRRSADQFAACGGDLVLLGRKYGVGDPLRQVRTRHGAHPAVRLLTAAAPSRKTRDGAAVSPCSAGWGQIAGGGSVDRANLVPPIRPPSPPPSPPWLVPPFWPPWLVPPSWPPWLAPPTWPWFTPPSWPWLSPPSCPWLLQVWTGCRQVLDGEGNGRRRRLRQRRIVRAETVPADGPFPKTSPIGSGVGEGLNALALECRRHVLRPDLGGERRTVDGLLAAHAVHLQELLRLGLVVDAPHADRGRQLRRVADEPGRLVVVRRTRLAGHLAAEPLAAVPVPFFTTISRTSVTLSATLASKALLERRLLVLVDVRAVVLDPLDRVRLGGYAAGGEGRVRVGHADGAGRRGTERERRGLDAPGCPRSGRRSARRPLTLSMPTSMPSWMNGELTENVIASRRLIRAACDSSPSLRWSHSLPSLSVQTVPS